MKFRAFVSAVVALAAAPLAAEAAATRAPTDLERVAIEKALRADLLEGIELTIESGLTLAEAEPGVVVACGRANDKTVQIPFAVMLTRNAHGEPQGKLLALSAPGAGELAVAKSCAGVGIKI